MQRNEYEHEHGQELEVLSIICARKVETIPVPDLLMQRGKGSSTSRRGKTRFCKMRWDSPYFQTESRRE